MVMNEGYCISYFQKENRYFIKQRSRLFSLLMHEIQTHWVEEETSKEYINISRQAVAGSLVSEVRLRLCSVCTNDSSRPFELLSMLLQCVIL